jgi:hypothetical protein
MSGRWWRFRAGLRAELVVGHPAGVGSSGGAPWRGLAHSSSGAAGTGDRGGGSDRLDDGPPAGARPGGATYRDFAPRSVRGHVPRAGCGAVVLTWLYNRSGGSILLVAVWHGLYNVVGATQAAAGLLAACQHPDHDPGHCPDRARGTGPPPRTALRAGTPVNRHRRPPGIRVTNRLASPVLRPLLHGPAGHRLGRHRALIRYRAAAPATSASCRCRARAGRSR